MKWRILGGVLAWSVAGCSGPAEFDRASVLLLTLDTTRADVLGCYGHLPGVTPNLDALAARGVLFEAAQTVTPLTLPAHASILTGIYPPQHGVRDNGVAVVPDSARTLAEVAREKGYQTAAFVASIVLDAPFGLDQGFETYDAPPRRRLEEAPQRGAERSASEMVDLALSWLAARDPARPFFLWLHLYDPHFPYAPPAPFAAQFERDPYQGEVAYVDHEIGRLLEGLRENGTLERTVVLVVADHGESLGEHGEAAHGRFCYGATQRVPLFFTWPAGLAPSGQAIQRRRGERTQEVASVVDVYPTLREAMGAGADGEVDGCSLFRPRPEPAGVYFESYFGYLNYGWSPLAGWMDARGKYLHSSEPEYYDWRRDPAEEHDLAAQSSAEIGRYQRAIAELTAKKPLDRNAGGGLDDELVASIQALGYAALAGGEGGLPDPLKDTGLPSPRSQIPSLLQETQAEELKSKGRIDEAADVYAEMLRSNPRNSLALNKLAACRLHQGQIAEAVKLYRRLVAIGPERGRSHYELGLALRSNGEKEEAIEAFRTAVELTGGRVRYLEALKELLASEGRSAEAAELGRRYGSASKSDKRPPE